MQLKASYLGKSFTTVLFADFMSIAGLWFGIFANLQFLTAHLPSDFAKSLVLISGPIFLIIASPVAGGVIDRYPLKTIIARSGYIQLFSACIQLGAFLTGSVLMLVIAMIFLNIANAFYTPSLRSAIPAMVPKEKLLQANATYMNVTTLARISITGFSGIALSFLPLWGMYGLVIACYAVMNVLRFSIDLPEIEIRKSNRRLPFIEVFTLLRSIPALTVLMVNIAFIYLFLGGSTMIILKLSQIHSNPVIQGFLYGVEGACLFLAGLVVKKLMASGNLLFLNTLLVVASGISVLCIGLGTYWVPAAYCGYGLYGFFAGLWSPTYSTISQLMVPEQIRGRFFAFQEMWNRMMQQLALLYTGFMFDLVGVNAHLSFTGCMILFGGCIVLLVVNRGKLRVLGNT